MTEVELNQVSVSESENPKPKPAPGPTPGPWQVGVPGRGRFVVSSKKHGKGVCVMQNCQPTEHNPHPQEADANARLIAATPDLLKIAKFLSFHLKGAGESGHFVIIANGPVHKEIEAILAKAEGKAP